MKTILLLVLLLFFVGCQSSTKFGDCIGINDDPQQHLNYKYSVRNIIIGILFVELIAPPVIVVLNELKCPVSKKD